MKRVIVGISGASGAGLGLKFLESLPKEIEKYCVISEGAKRVLSSEENIQETQKFEQIKSRVSKVFLFGDDELGACIASGSFVCEAMVVIPCSQNTLAKIACGISDTLITRCASVMIKEQRKLLLAPREIPFSQIALENMLKLSQIGVTIAPPVFGYYAGKSLDEIENMLIGKWCDNLGIPFEYGRWQGCN
ncbi:UbiX family flavin prenyltransferase [Helicobacter pullorum]|uniref:3-octaprenyl-4-hydroxybenzoate carboxy-lyase n=1 Tax=Helicobacter pullorum TaxID=35818 RepID=A0A0N1MQD4_9HELI|nr:UbiX family flavin prenyltransferase [Helicobacter pullorum]HIS08667.1 UbiX family flavin prenyltransferase [Candidatus Scatomorpha intestinipullorum]KPH52563.1 3-octaprenyl-4-hydroxybenzoate carboxy-lyase [Helicobacter pullorum]KPH55150.1 3-octaprenyl-4-hydroxybenzoate carboxy-lyase [Helicobacter pullorum]OCR04307.1 3-octaprenyl-4-hydroxybenzoate carboxy-lyase [Helicobacter pullorum]OCR08192.1 3-octaprenyl-4-hydroxybenzoate carboxy-lyase [Helicobacter pullorum]